MLNTPFSLNKKWKPPRKIKCFRKNCPSQNEIAPFTFFYAQIKFMNIHLFSLREKKYKSSDAPTSAT